MVKIEWAVQVLVLISLAVGAVLWSQEQFASAAGTAQTFQQHSVVTQEVFNDSRIERLRFELEQVRARMRAGVVYDDDAQTEAWLISELERAKAYAEELRRLKAGLK